MSIYETYCWQIFRLDETPLGPVREHRVTESKKNNYYQYCWTVWNGIFFFWDTLYNSCILFIMEVRIVRPGGRGIEPSVITRWISCANVKQYLVHWKTPLLSTNGSSSGGRTSSSVTICWFSVSNRKILSNCEFISSKRSASSISPTFHVMSMLEYNGGHLCKGLTRR